MNSPKDYLTDRQQKEKEMEQAEKMLIDTLGEEKARKLILDMKIGGILAGLQTNFMDLDTAQKKLFSLLTSEVEKAKKKYIEMGELIGAGKVLDNLWDNSYYSMGKLGSDRIREELEYYFGKDWSTDMYKIIAKNGMRAQSVKPLKDYTNEQRKALSELKGGGE